jgi:hypothetical protein
MEEAFTCFTRFPYVLFYAYLGLRSPTVKAMEGVTLQVSSLLDSSLPTAVRQGSGGGAG